jgi:hypothetical protein
MSTNALKVSAEMPIQSDHLPLITYYFFLSLLYSLISFGWFFLMERFKTKRHLPAFLVKSINWLKIRKNKDQSMAQINEANKFDECISILNEIAFTFMFLTMSVSFIFIWTTISC